MPAKHLLTEKRLQKALLKLPIPIHKRVLEALKIIQHNPMIGVKLHGELENYYKYRIGDYRIVYRFNKEISTVNIVKIEHRQGVYK